MPLLNSSEKSSKMPCRGLILYALNVFRSQAVVIGQTLLEGGWLEPVPQTRYAQDFCDEYALYQLGPVSNGI